MPKIVCNAFTCIWNNATPSRTGYCSKEEDVHIHHWVSPRDGVDNFWCDSFIDTKKKKVEDDG